MYINKKQIFSFCVQLSNSLGWNIRDTKVDFACFIIKKTQHNDADTGFWQLNT